MSFTGIGSIVLLALTIAPAALATPVQTPTPVVDLGYATYQGYHDNTYDLNVFKGIRYAAPPVGKLRWQAPQAPPVNRKSIQPATKQPPFCPQSGGAKLPEVYGFNSALGNEDCLFLNVYAPPGAKDLPVLLWIHGGGYGLFGAVYDPSELISTNDNGFISVMIQYRLGAFGFLSSEGVHKHGKTNAGLLDMRFALEWVQEHIEKFGGDASRVTIAGESSGAGSVMLQSMAYGGREDHLFNNVIAASPYSTALHQYDGKVPTSHYEDFASRAGCRNGRHMSEAAVFACLVKADTDTLQYASANVSVSGEWGTWAFLPVVDGDFIQELPSKQLLQKKVSGKRVLSGNNANEGVPLSPPFVNSTADFLGYVHSAFPLFSRRDYSRLLDIYEFQDSSPENTGPRYDTLGDRGPTALNQSEMATGLQQTVFNIYAESSFDCPSYWLADAFAGGNAKESWKYQYSITPSYHGADLSAYFSVGTTTPTRGLIDAFQKIWGNFIINDTPVISITDAKGGADNATVPEGVHGDISWPKWNSRSPVLMNLNTTGGTTVYVEVTDSLSYWLQEGPGVTNEFSLADASKWEGGRGKRCEFWRSVGPRVPT
ncbi:CAZyme family CE10 [Penicillium concentricum]|uniref:Carboxylic ester hydrolase n=1 Tax=Penicillium concentricum TaxID=293559 RepID=A0A9W9S8F2_9EURO|nr:CAZyme family CE10 [Penicillium concentricum]KAJ5372869.1 CAZyme family CE10 [Penicillium concentricum]